MKTYIFSLFLLSVPSFGMSVPANTMIIDKNQKSITGMNEHRFNKVIDRFEGVWGKIVQEDYDKKLIIDRQWNNGKVQSYATRDNTNNPVLAIFGGMARHSEMTEDGLMFILCHELGHYLGGAPKKLRGNTTKRSWSSAEGQADYFASQKCLPKIFSEGELGEKSFEDMSKIETVCHTNICKRTLKAGLSAARVFASIKHSFEMPEVDRNLNEFVESTSYKHPSAQCRLDTIIAGALCDRERSREFDDRDAEVASCFTEKQVNEVKKGYRPRCWFSPFEY